jgi:DNA-binding NarL/FixJ family response regulator
MKDVMTGKAKILIVDDHPIVCEGLAQLINQEIDLVVVGEARDAAEALKKIFELEPDLVIVDISLVGKSGIELTSEIRSLYPTTPVLALSMHTERLYVERALNAGARGYVSKGEATAVITGAIRKVLNGRIYLSDGMSESLLDSLYGRAHERGRMAVEKLTDREFEVFRLIGRGLKNHQIAELFGVSVKTVDAHREHIKEKLQIKDSHELFGYALQWSRTSGVGK